MEHSAGENYVGQKVCAQCHLKQSIQWSGSHHEQAMQKATLDSVLANFNNAQFTRHNITSTFFFKANEFWVNTDNPEGDMQDYRIQYTFGVYPLQQYLIAMPGGRLQVLDIAWDARPESLGGQRWFALHPDKSDADDVLHWTGPNLNWNYMCADCHSTNLKKNYDPTAQTYATQWSAINVSCEACHGAGRKHQQWALSHGEKAESKDDSEEVYNNKGLSIVLNERKGVVWRQNPDNGKPFRSSPRLSQTEIDTCARCHSRRGQMAHPKAGDRFMDNYRPSLLTSGLYHVDGQIQDEVYVYGSFLQSKMYQAGVTCSDCHDPHIAGLKLPGDRVCNRCHQPEKFRTIEHHHHPASANTTCLDCHMPVKTYMGVDQRHDHSFRIPRPDISQTLETPGVCHRCHADKPPKWATEQVTRWYGDKKSGLQQYAPILDAQRKQINHNNQQIKKLLQDSNQPVIARATALSLLSGGIDTAMLQLIEQQLHSDNAMLRVAALMALGSWSESNGMAFDKIAQLAFPFLDDPIRLVRLEAARILAPLDETQLQTAQQKSLQSARQEYIDSLLFNAERPESQVNLGNYYLQMNDFEKAEKAYRLALSLQPKFVPAWVNLGNFYSELNRDKDALQALEQGLKQTPEPENADLYYALGLTQVRLKKITEASKSLAKAAQLSPDNAYYSYVYGIALNSYKGPEEALVFLQKAHQLNPHNRDILSLLVSINRDTGNIKMALNFAEKVQAQEPENPEVKTLIMQLKTLLQ